MLGIAEMMIPASYFVAYWNFEVYLMIPVYYWIVVNYFPGSYSEASMSFQE